MFFKAQSASGSRHLAHLGLVAALSFAGLAAVALYRFPPTIYAFYPVCPVHEYLHLECPGCGTTRALAALLHGHLEEAIRSNALVVLLLLPAAALYGLLVYVRTARGDAFRWPELPPRFIYAGVAVVVAFTVWRNF